MTAASPRIILIDDLRSFVDRRHTEVARTSAAGAALLSRYQDQRLDELWLDHDLGEDDTIWPVVEILERAAFEGHRYDIGVINIHSANPAGSAKMAQALRHWGYHVRVVAGSADVGYLGESALNDSQPVPRQPGSPVDQMHSLENLEGHHWGEAPDRATRMVATTHELRKKPVGELTTEDLRLLISQRVGLVHLVPIALDVLQADPLAEGDMYEGDLLHAVLRSGPDFWAEHTNLLQRLHAAIDTITDPPEWLTTDLFPGLDRP